MGLPHIYETRQLFSADSGMSLGYIEFMTLKTQFEKGQISNQMQKSDIV